MRGTARIGAAAAALLACLACAAPAGAARTELVRMNAYEPHLAGGAVVFKAPDTTGLRIMRATPGQPPATLTTLAFGPSTDPDDDCCTGSSAFRLAASESHVSASRYAFLSVKGTEGENSYALQAGPATGPLQTLHQCRDDHPIAVAGTLLAYTNGCTEAGGTPPVVVRDLAQQGAPSVAALPQPARVTELDMAGQHLALRRAVTGAPEIAVRDRAQPNDSYTVPATNVVQFSLQADGKLAVKEQTQSTCRVAWYSKAEPVAHHIDICPAGDVRLAGDRIVLTRETASGATLDLVELNGQARQIAAFPAAGVVVGFDFDGARVAYAEEGCVASEDAIYLDDLAGPPTPAGSAACPVVFPSSKVRASSSGLVTVKTRCEVGCQGFASLTRGGKLMVTSTKRVHQSRGTGKVTLRLTSAARKLLRERGELKVRAVVQSNERDAIPRDYKRTIRLLAPK